jgi:hypothetical protein
MCGKNGSMTTAQPLMPITHLKLLTQEEYGLQGKDSIRAIFNLISSCTDTTNYIPTTIGPIAKFGDEDQLCYRAPVIFFSDSSTPGKTMRHHFLKWI